jgi:predicted nucleic acid-binding protein
MILLDTNLLTRMTRSNDPQAGIARTAIQRLRTQKERIIIVPQNLYEFWTVATRRPGPPPAGQNRLGMTPNQASQWLRFFERRFSLLPDRPDLVMLWHALVESHGITGFRAHNARLVAATQSYGITRLLTFNASCPNSNWPPEGVRHDCGLRLRPCARRQRKRGAAQAEKGSGSHAANGITAAYIPLR